eukprot:sb/3468391/
MCGKIRSYRRNIRHTSPISPDLLHQQRAANSVNKTLELSVVPRPEQISELIDSGSFFTRTGELALPSKISRHPGPVLSAAAPSLRSTFINPLDHPSVPTSYPSIPQLVPQHIFLPPAAFGAMATAGSSSSSLVTKETQELLLRDQHHITEITNLSYYKGPQLVNHYPTQAPPLVVQPTVQRFNRDTYLPHLSSYYQDPNLIRPQTLTNPVYPSSILLTCSTSVALAPGRRPGASGEWTDCVARQRSCLIFSHKNENSDRRRI